MLMFLVVCFRPAHSAGTVNLVLAVLMQIVIIIETIVLNDIPFTNCL